MKKMNDTKKLGGIVAIVAAAAVVIAISANAVDQRGNRQENLAASVRTNTAASGGVQSGTSQAQKVTEESARQTALEHAGVASGDVTRSSVRTDRDEGRSVYEVEFLTASDKYDYEIDLVTGEIVKHEKESLNSASARTSENASGSANTAADSNVSSGTADSDIGKNKAQSIALEHAGVKASQATIKKVARDYDDGRLVYDVDFITSDWEYSYEIQASDGTVRQADRERLEVYSTGSGQSGSASGGSGNISVDKAKEIALKHSGVSGKVNYTKAKMERDDGINVYEIEFFQNGMEYDYEIQASDGKILDWSAEYDD